MTVLVWTVNLLGWPVIHFSIASGALRLPSECFRARLLANCTTPLGTRWRFLPGVARHSQMEIPAPRWCTLAKGLCQEEAPLTQSCVISHNS